MKHPALVMAALYLSGVWRDSYICLDTILDMEDRPNGGEDELPSKRAGHTCGREKWDVD